jgi:hypothetical protein
MTVLSAAQSAGKYGVPDSNPGSDFARDQYPGNPKVLPYANETRTSRSSKMAWENVNNQIGSFMKFDDGQSTPTPPPGG